ncbi:MAG: TROVE domain-containing protein [Propionibacteriaceae bacterium]|nr:TROVE domain-containing protein [Propionibacteriaceae bacterium]
MDPLRTISTRTTPQNEPADSRQVPNSAGGHTFQLDDHARLRRFLTLGVDGGTYYASPRDLALDNAQVLARVAAADPAGLVATIVEVSEGGIAPKQGPALFALAYATSVADAAPLALAALPRVARTGTHLFTFARYVEQFRGWGRGLRRAVGNWYLDKEADALAYQAVKYRQREGWSHRDLLRLSHPATTVPELRATFEWIVRSSLGDDTPELIGAFTRAQQATDVATWTELIRRHRLTWEMLPDQALSEPAVWEALLDAGIPQTALLRQLPRLTRLGLLPGLGGRTDEVCAQLTDPQRLRRARVHPVAVLAAARTYTSGRSHRGSSTWEPTAKVSDALDAAFYAAFGTVTPAGKRTLIGLDVSGSMDWAGLAGTPLTAREASAALSLVQLATEPAVQVMAFQDQFVPLDISPKQRLDDVLRRTDDLPFGPTDCAQPMLYAAKQKLEVDTFIIYTDNETWCGRTHPHQALVRYREQSGIDARLIVVGMTANGFSIADPDDAGMLDVAGFDLSVPNLISEFSRGF